MCDVWHLYQVKSVGLIFPHQLFMPHPVLEVADEVYLVDDAWLYQGKGEWEIRPHRKRILYLKACVLQYMEQLKASGVAVERVSSLEQLASDYQSIKVCQLTDEILQKELERRFCEAEIEWLESPSFVTPSVWAEQFFSEGKKPFMKTFYEAQRKRMGILVDGCGKPNGGKWSFDENNRKKLPKKAIVPEDPRTKYSESEIRIIAEARAELEENGLWVKAVGNGDSLRYPLSHRAAERWLEQFLAQRFVGFGTYEDALSQRGDFLYHSVLTPMLNIGLLTPQQVVDSAIAYAEQNGVAMNDLEGFVRQIIGWREFIAIIYRKHGSWMRNQNFWGFTEAIPVSVWKGKTGLEPLDSVLEKVQREGYAHHIERLMVLGNFFMLMRIEPNAVYRWFMEMFVDAYDWVMVPNVYGMSQYASGGFMVTKPYLSGSNYLKKMSDFPSGPWCAVWDALYWSFIDDHRTFFASQFRMKMMLGHLDRMGAEKLAEHHALANEFRQCMREGKVWPGDTLF
ncbi:cryptochrome/photolyase family protein [Rubritalea sp.]|uniref:cryptochrome/photolyase family protein n=1 Tax=Rubritalea sp. TaxID=2109375 RepID=UPI003EF5AF3C